MKLNKKTIALIISVCLILISGNYTIYAHTEDTEEEFYYEYLYNAENSTKPLHYTDWAIKEGKFGWRIFSLNHSGTPNITYYFEGDYTSFEIEYENGDIEISDVSYLKPAFRAGAQKWNQAIFQWDTPFSVTEVDNFNQSMVKVMPYYEDDYLVPRSAFAAYVDSPNAIAEEHNHHIISVDIYLHIRYLESDEFETNSITCAHEIGHVFGLADLDYNRPNPKFKDVLMGYSRNFTVTGPTDADIKGAAVITGIHNNEDHVFDRYGLYHNSNVETDVNEIYHRKICNICDGYILEPHAYEYGNLGDCHRKRCALCFYSVEAEEHEFSQWETMGSSSHSRHCIDCGKMDSENHSIGYRNTNSSIHTVYCTGNCGYSATAAHSYGSWEYDTPIKHMRECICGRAQFVKHTVSNWTSDASGHTGRCSVCGAVVTLPHSLQKWEDHDPCYHVKKCSGCDYMEYDPHYEHWDSFRDICLRCGRRGIIEVPIYKYLLIEKDLVE